MNDIILTIGVLVIIIGPIILSEYKERKKRKQYIKDNPDFIKIKEIGIKETYLGLPTVSKLYGSKYIICPKCKSKKIYRTYGIMGSITYICSECRYEKIY